MTTKVFTLLAALTLLLTTDRIAEAGCAYCGDHGCANCAAGGGGGGGPFGNRGPSAATVGYGIRNYHGVRACKANLQYPWHCNYYHTEWGTPVALAIPPTAERSFNWGWGVGNTRLSRNWHQFQRPYPGDGAGAAGRSFAPTPPWPSDTTQFGVHYVRGPW